MKRIGLMGVLVLGLAVFLALPAVSFAQGAQVRQSPKAAVMQRIGADTDVTIEYSRPAVKGREIWGALVPYGMAPGNKYSKDQPFPWRAGANENTTIEFKKDVLVEGTPLAAGKYGIHMIPGPKMWTIIFSKNNSSWGSFSYKQEEDALRITVSPDMVNFHEWLTYGFDDLSPTSAKAFLLWEKLKVSFKISLPQ